jgi:hypothetical protein
MTDFRIEERMPNNIPAAVTDRRKDAAIVGVSSAITA